MTIDNILKEYYKLDLNRQEFFDLLIELRKINITYRNVMSISRFLGDYKGQYEDEVIDYMIYLLDNLHDLRYKENAAGKLFMVHMDISIKMRDMFAPKKKIKKNPLIIVSDADPYGEEDWSE
jgi:hypothetical protein